MSDTDKVYSETDAQHLIAREVAKQRLSDMQRLIEDGERRSISAFTELKQQIGSLSNLIEKTAFTMEKATDGLREEIKKDFATKIEVQSDFDKLNTKIDANWSKLVLIVSTVTAVGVLAQFLLRFIH